MGSPYFRFKQFTVWHDRCAMKVGTDGVLLGAWAGPDRPEEISGRGPQTILDIGTGSGLVALMLAQRFPEAQVTGIDCDVAAAAQARENFAGSPWPQRLRVRHVSLQELCRGSAADTAALRFDLIVSNPPFYDTTLTSPDPHRNTARHTGGLTHEELLLLSAGLLSDTGVFSLIVPSESEKSILRLADRSRLHLHRLTRVYSKPSSRPRRILASFGKISKVPVTEETVCLTDADGRRSEWYRKISEEFYLN